MRINEVSKITGLSEHTLRFYEKSGLLRNIAKRNGGIRDYCERDIDTLSVIECLKKTGMNLAEIRTFMEWCAMGDKTIEQRYNMFVARHAAAMQQMAEIKKMLKIIDYKIKYYDAARRAGTLAIYDGKKSHLPKFFEN